MITVHHLQTSQSERIVWLCEELGLDYRLEIYQRRAENLLAPDHYKALHPMGTAPIITDDATTLAESGAICDYLNQRHGDGRLAPPVDDPDFADHLFWFHWANASYMTTLSVERALAKSGAAPAAPSYVADRARRSRDLIERRLSEVPFFGGRNLTTADIMMMFCLTTMRGFTGGTLDGMPATQDYVRRIAERPAYRRAMDKAEGVRDPARSSLDDNPR